MIPQAIYKILLFAALGAGATLYVVNSIQISRLKKSVAKTEKVNLELQADLDKTQSKLRGSEDVVKAKYKDILQLKEIKRADSLNFVSRISGMQNVIAQLNNKHAVYKKQTDALIAELRLGLPPKECYNVFGKIVKCKDEQRR